MKIKVYLLWMTVAVLTFIFGISVTSFAQYFQSVYSAKVQQTELAEPEKAKPILVGEITFVEPKQVETSMVEKTNDSVKETEIEFDAQGDYYIIGDLPKGFKDFESLSIAIKDYENASEENNWEGIPIPPEGSVSTKKEFKFVRINIANKQIAFETESKKGISYKFVGKFVEGEEIKIGEYTEYPILEGSLIKMRDGKKIAESKVKFGIIEGCGS